tara:strand:+ start:410 stop:1531 length:1122 start_codon:yes stop_codon:yes gene_type:complete
MTDSFIQIPLPNDKSVYELMRLDNGEKIKAIEIGLSAIELINEKKLRYENSEYNEKLNETEEKYNAIIKHLKEQLNDNIEEKIKLQENFSMEKKKLHKDITENIELQFEAKLNHNQIHIDSLDQQLALKTTQLEKINEKHFKDERERTELLHQKHQNDIEKLRLKYENDMKEIVNRMCKSEENSSVKGKISENAMYQKLNILFPKNTIEDTHSEAGRGDFIMTDSKGKSIMLENKDYNKNVPKKEIDKFKRDLTNNSDIWGGILLSNASGICNKKDYQIEFVENKIAIYLHFTNKDPNKIKNAYDIMLALNDIDIDFSNKELVEKLAERSTEFKRKVNKSRKDLDKFYKSMLENILDIETLTKTIYTDIKIKY